MEPHVRQSSLEVNYDNVEEMDEAFDVVEPAYVLVYRRVVRGQGADSRFVSCVRVEVMRRFWKRIFGQATRFLEASVFFWDEGDVEHCRKLTVPAVFAFDEAPQPPESKTVVMQNRTLFRHFAPVLKGDVAMRLLYERPLFKIKTPAETPPRRASPARRRREEAATNGDRRLRREFEKMKIGEDNDSLRRSIKSLDSVGGSLVENRPDTTARPKRVPALFGRMAGTRQGSSRSRTPGPAEDVVTPLESRIPRATRRRGAKVGKKFSLEVDAHDTVETVKRKIFAARGYPPSKQHLVFNGVAMSDGDRLADFGLREDSTLMLWLRNEDGTMKPVDL